MGRCALATVYFVPRSVCDISIVSHLYRCAYLIYHDDDVYVKRTCAQANLADPLMYLAKNRKLQLRGRWVSHLNIRNWRVVQYKCDIYKYKIAMVGVCEIFTIDTPCNMCIYTNRQSQLQEDIVKTLDLRHLVVSAPCNAALSGRGKP